MSQVNNKIWNQLANKWINFRTLWQRKREKNYNKLNKELDKRRSNWTTFNNNNNNKKRKETQKRSRIIINIEFIKYLNLGRHIKLYMYTEIIN